MAATRRFIFLLLIFIYCEQAVWAKTKVEVLNNFMYQSGKGGHQVADGSGNQQITINEPVLYIDSKIGRNTNIFGSALLDLWSSASEAIFDSQTGASGKGLAGGGNSELKKAVLAATPQRHIQNRMAFNLGLSQKMQSWTFTPRLGFSTEFDYRSFNGGFTLDKSFANDNFVVSLNYQTFLDSTRPFDIGSSSFKPWQAKRTNTAGLSASQILTRSDMVLVAYSFTNQTGFLAGTQNTIDLNGARINEIMPSSRNRQSATLRYVHGFSDTIAGHLDYRFYFDNWGIRSHTIEPSLYFSFLDEAGLVKLFYRFYLQSPTTYYADNFTKAQKYMTSDSDLSRFKANEAGLLVAYKWEVNNSFIKAISLNGTGTYYRRSNGLTGNILQLGLTGEF